MSQMHTDIERYAQAMPQYGDALSFLQNILDFQAALADKIEPGLQIEPAVAREKWEAGEPLFADKSPAIPSPLFRQALAELRPLLPPGDVLQEVLDRLLASELVVSSDLEEVLADLITDSDACIRRLADAASTTPDTVAPLLRIVLSPFFEKPAALYREWIREAGWRRGICPICGSEPWMARLDRESGERTLACSLCRTEWAFDRLRCPFCGGDDQPKVRYFTVDDDGAHRVDCCDRCQRYIKTVDDRVAGRPANLLVEDVITSHLDTLAREHGYH